MIQRTDDTALHILQVKQRRRELLRELECPVCHKMFTPRHSRQKCCCEEHGKKLYNMQRSKPFDRTPRECPQCHKMFTPVQKTQQF